MTDRARHLIVSVDYEVFGNGSGCVEKCLLEPTDRLLAIADAFRIPLTLFVETSMPRAMESFGAHEDEVSRVRAQIIRAVQAGHRAELHVHPQWEGAARDEAAGKWRVDMARWRIGDLSRRDALRLVREGKDWIEGLLRSVAPDYTCTAFRAGGWCIQPSASVLSSLASLGFRVDSTVAPGMVNAASGDWFDFRAAPDAPAWRVSADVCEQSDAGMWEVPITTCDISTVKRLRTMFRRTWSSARYAPGCVRSGPGPNDRLRSLAGNVSKLAHLSRTMLDFCALPVDAMIDVTKGWCRAHASAGVPVPIVAIGHSKNLTGDSEAALNGYLEWASRRSDIVCSTFPQWLAALRDMR